MELRQLWAVVARRWWLVALPALVAALLTLPLLRDVIAPPVTYAAAVRFTASQPPASFGGDGGNTFEDRGYIPWLASEYVVINLQGWVRTESFAREVRDALAAQDAALDMAPDVAAIQGALNADAVRSVMTVYLSWPDAAQLERIAEAVVQVLQERVSAYWPQFGDVPPQVVALDQASAAPVSAGLADRLSPLFRILIGLLAGLGLAFLAEYLDTTIRTRHEVESDLALPVLGELPPHR